MLILIYVMLAGCFNIFDYTYIPDPGYLRRNMDQPKEVGKLIADNFMDWRNEGQSLCKSLYSSFKIQILSLMDLCES